MATKIYTIQDLQNMDNDLAGEYELANDIDAAATEGWNAGAGFSPIGLAAASTFTGSFDGKEFEISNLHINRPSTHRIGLFRYPSGAIIQNVRLYNVVITGQWYTGVVAGYSYYTAYSNCITSGLIIGTDDEVGGIAGYSYLDTFEDCISHCKVETTDSYAYIGGLVGYSYRSTYLRCKSIGDILGTGDCGGLIGYSDSDIISLSCSLSNILEAMDTDFGEFGGLIGYSRGDTIADSYARGNVESIHSSGAIVGGLIGYARGVGTLDNSFSTGLLEVADEGSSDVGGLIGLQYSTPITVTESFWDKDTSGRATSAGGVGKTTAEMKQEQTFLDASWDLDDIWGVSVSINDGYPELQWVEPPIIPPDPLPPVRLKITPYTLPYRSLKIYTGRRI